MVKEQASKNKSIAIRIISTYLVNILIFLLTVILAIIFTTVFFHFGESVGYDYAVQQEGSTIDETQ